MRRDDHVEGRLRDEDDARTNHVAQLLVGEVVAELVEDAVGREVRVERRAEVGRREVAAEFVVEHLRRVPHDVTGALVELGLRDDADASRAPVRAAGGGVRHGREVGQVGANRDAEPARRIDADDVGGDVARPVRGRRLGRRAVTLCDEIRRRHAAVNETRRGARAAARRRSRAAALGGRPAARRCATGRLGRPTRAGSRERRAPLVRARAPWSDC